MPLGFSVAVVGGAVLQLGVGAHGLMLRMDEGIGFAGVEDRQGRRKHDAGLPQHAHVLHRVVAYDELGLGEQPAEQGSVAAEGRGVLHAFRRNVVDRYRIVPFRLAFWFEILVVYDGIPAVDDGNLQNFAVGGKVGHFDVDGVDAAGVEGADEVLDLRG